MCNVSSLAIGGVAVAVWADCVALVQDCLSEYGSAFLWAIVPQACSAMLPLFSGADGSSADVQQPRRTVAQVASALLAAMKPRDAVYLMPDVARMVLSGVHRATTQIEAAPEAVPACPARSCGFETRGEAAQFMVQWALQAAGERFAALPRKAIGLVEDCLHAVQALLQAQVSKGTHLCSRLWY